MKKHSCLALVLLSLLICPAAVWSHDDAVPGGRLGKVSFANSCSEKVKPQFEIGVAMLHSFWFSAAEKTFDDVLAKDPQCAIAAWGLASILMNNPLAGTVARGREEGLRSSGERAPGSRGYAAGARLYRRRIGLLRGLGQPRRACAAGRPGRCVREARGALSAG